MWLYYPRISDSMLAEIVNVVGASIADLSREADRIEQRHRQLGGSDETQQRVDAVAEAIRQRVELQRVVKQLVDGGWKPDLDDGAIVNAGPLRALFRHKDWADKVQEFWKEVQKGEHDWSHLAMWLRHDAVLQRCRTEKDLAIAHDHLDLYQPPTAKKRGRKAKAERLPLPIHEEYGDE